MQNLQDQFTELLDSTKLPALSDLSKSTILHVSIPINKVDPLAIIESVKPDVFCYWEKPDSEFSICTQGLIDIDDSPMEINRSRFINLSLIDHPLAAPFFIGGQAFDIEGRNNGEWASFGEENFVLPEWSVIRSGNFTLFQFNTLVNPEQTRDEIIKELISSIELLMNQILSYADDLNEPTLQPLETFSLSNLSHQEWISQINEAKSLINTEELSKIVISRTVQIKANRNLSVTRLANTLRNHYSGCYIFIFQFEKNVAFVGASPERLVSFHKHYILTEALAGSITRGKSAKEDAWLERRLFNSGKDRSEHQYVVSEIIDKLSYISDNIQFSDTPVVKKISNVQHLHTPITAWIQNESDVNKILQLLHPTPAVGGLPKEKALSNIRKIEKHSRGWYAAPVGWFNLNGSGEFAVGIRSGLISGNKALFYAGCGIVKDSNPMKEWDETELKLIPMLSALKNA